MKRLVLIAVIAVGAIATIVAAGSGSSTKKAANYSAGAATPAAGAANSAIRTAHGALGTYLVDAQGRTLYLFEADKRNLSNCSSACLSIWPAFGANRMAPVAKGGVAAAKLGVTTGRGKSIVTYNGHPLYYYAGDQKPGATTGQGLDQFGGGWYVVTPAGAKIDKG